MPRIRFLPDGLEANVLPGDTLLAAARRAGLALVSPCGGRGGCGKCLVRLAEGTLDPTDLERDALSPEQLDAGWRLACQARARDKNLTVEVPAASRDRGLEVLGAESDEEAEASAIDPAVRRRVVDVPAPTLEGPCSDLACFTRAAELADAEISLDLVRALTDALRAEGGRVTVTTQETTEGRARVIDIAPGDSKGPLLGACFDLGTTTVAGELHDLATGKRLALASAANPQSAHGDDVISRIEYAMSGEAAQRELAAEAGGVIGALLDEMLAGAGLPDTRVAEVVVAGNTAMTHLACRLDPASLAVSPFVPVLTNAINWPAAEFALARAERVLFLPCVSAYLGGDLVAGLLATGLARAEGPALLVDVGTNGEIALAFDGCLVAASTAAGPAFEGARLSCGMRASAGAVSEVKLKNGDLAVATIGGAPPMGLCGTGLLDAVAALLACGLAESTGALALPDSLPGALRARRVDRDDDPAMRLAGEGKKTVTLTQRDLREFQLAKGAIRAGVEILLAECGLEACSLGRVVLAGAFGTYLDRASALATGLLPEKLEPHRIEFAGNTALRGARRYLLERGARAEAARLAREVRSVELSARADFRDAFGEAMLFPERGGAPCCS